MGSNPTLSAINYTHMNFKVIKINFISIINNFMKKYYGEQTEKAIKNFPFSFRKTPMEFILAIVEIKKAAAIAHFKVGELDRKRKEAIVKACDEILAGKHQRAICLAGFSGRGRDI